MLSSDVSAAYDPMFAEVFEKRNTAFFAKGLVFNKYTGSRGKNGSNDASAEYLAKIRRVMDDGGVAYQFSELGKVDAGGGGTIAYIMANYGMEVIDSGVAVPVYARAVGDHQQGGRLRGIQGIQGLYPRNVTPTRRC